MPKCVKSHRGGYYTTSLSYDEIEEPCEMCLESDEVIFEYETIEEFKRKAKEMKVPYDINIYD